MFEFKVINLKAFFNRSRVHNTVNVLNHLCFEKGICLKTKIVERKHQLTSHILINNAINFSVINDESVGRGGDRWVVACEQAPKGAKGLPIPYSGSGACSSSVNLF